MGVVTDPERSFVCLSSVAAVNTDARTPSAKYIETLNPNTVRFRLLSFYVAQLQRCVVAFASPLVYVLFLASLHG